VTRALRPREELDRPRPDAPRSASVVLLGRLGSARPGAVPLDLDRDRDLREGGGPGREEVDPMRHWNLGLQHHKPRRRSHLTREASRFLEWTSQVRYWRGRPRRRGERGGAWGGGGATAASEPVECRRGGVAGPWSAEGLARVEQGVGGGCGGPGQGGCGTCGEGERTGGGPCQEWPCGRVEAWTMIIAIDSRMPCSSSHPARVATGKGSGQPGSAGRWGRGGGGAGGSGQTGGSRGGRGYPCGLSGGAGGGGPREPPATGAPVEEQGDEGEWEGESWHRSRRPRQSSPSDHSSWPSS